MRNKQKAALKGASKENDAKSTRGQDKGREECKSRAYANKQPKSLDCGDLAQRYGKLQLTKIDAVTLSSCEKTCRALPDVQIDPTKSCSPMQCEVSGQI